MSKYIIGPVFITQNVNAELYRKMLHQIFQMTEMNKIEDYWFMQDGARPHRTREIFDLLGKKFKDRLIGLDSERYTGGGIDWPPYSPDLNPCDYFLWGYLKDKVYRTEPKTLDEL